MGENYSSISHNVFHISTRKTRKLQNLYQNECVLNVGVLCDIKLGYLYREKQDHPNHTNCVESYLYFLLIIYERVNIVVYIVDMAFQFPYMQCKQIFKTLLTMLTHDCQSD